MDWLKKLDKKEQYRILQRIDRLIENNYGDCKRLKNSELSELRFMTNKGYRIYYKNLDNVIVLLIAGGDKSNQDETIKKANNYYQDFKERYQDDKLE